MHEVGLIAAALRRAQDVAEQAGAGRIARLTFAVVPGGHVTTEVVEALVAALSTGTMAEGAEVVIERRDGRYFCAGCGATYTSASDDPACPSCGLRGVLDDGTDDLTLVSIDVDD